MSGNKIDKVIKYTGCKNYLASWIIEHFPESCRDMTYLEPFFGSGAVFFNKAPSAIETVNDLSGDIVNLFRQIRDNHKELLRMIRNTPWSREEYELSVKEAENDTERARHFLIRMWMTVGGNTYCRNGMRTWIKCGGGGDIKNFQRNINAVIEKTRERLIPLSGMVQIERRDALELIKKYNKRDVLMYLDPPYVKSTRHHKKIYRHEMEDEEHIKLLEAVKESKAKIVISGYESELYSRYLCGWITDKKQSPDEVNIGRTEHLWMNYNPPGKYLFDFNFTREKTIKAAKAG